MPYIEDEKEKAARKKREAERKTKDDALNKAYEGLTDQQKLVMCNLWEALDRWYTETNESYLLYETVLNLQSMCGKFYRAFPLVTQNKE
jgi:hypothetical protein